MNQSIVEPLRKHTLNGDLYTRLPEIETLLPELKSLPREQLAQRMQIPCRSNPSYVPTECIVHLVRATKSDQDEAWFEQLFKVLSKRILRALPRAVRNDDKETTFTEEAIRDEVFGRFVEILCNDRQGYDDRLDYFEIRFYGALARLRLTAQEKAWGEQERHVPLERDDESMEISAEAEAAAATDPFDVLDIRELSYRLRLDAAIKQLSRLEGRIIQMLRLGFPVDSNDPGAVTIAKTLKKSEKTIRTHRDLAFAFIRDYMKGGAR